MMRSGRAGQEPATPRRSERTGSLTATLEQDEADGPWALVVWNDPVNLMNYVVHVFRSHFGYSRARAEELMMQVHREGRATVARGGRERIEKDLQAMHSYGLHATMDRAGEL